MDEVKLLGFWASPPVYRVIWALKLKGIKYEYIEEDLSNKSALLLQSNPVHKKVPVLIHGDRAISESSVILEYIEETWPHNPLFPKDAYGRALSRFWMNFRLEKLYIIKSTEENREKISREVLEVLKILEEQALKDDEFFGGDTIGMLDIFYGPIAHWFKAMEECAGVQVMEPSTLPRLCAWAQRFKEISVIKDDFPPYEDLVLYMKRQRQTLLSEAPTN